MIKNLAKILCSTVALYFLGMCTAGLIIVGCFTIGVVPTILTFIFAYAVWIFVAVQRKWWEES